MFVGAKVRTSRHIERASVDVACSSRTKVKAKGRATGSRHALPLATGESARGRRRHDETATGASSLNQHLFIKQMESAVVGATQRGIMYLNPRSKREQGIALITVTGTLAVIAVMAAHMTSTSEITALEAKAQASRSRLKYAAESAAARAYWLWLTHRERFPSRHNNLSREQEELLPTAEGERWYADGQTRRIEKENIDVEVTLQDAKRGYNLFRGHAENVLEQRFGEDVNAEKKQSVEKFLHALEDYRKDKKTPSLLGIDTPDYEQQGYYAMPRNGEIQFREELFWLPNTADVLGLSRRPDDDRVRASLRLIPPEGRGKNFLKSTDKPSFFSSSAEFLQQKLDLTQQQLEVVLDAREQAQKSGAPLGNMLGPDLSSQIRRNFSLSESGIVTIEALAREDSTSRRIVITREPEPANLHYSKGDLISNWQKKVY